ncbi:unnamed protein product [Sphagnum balticum]
MRRLQVQTPQYVTVAGQIHAQRPACAHRGSQPITPSCIPPFSPSRNGFVPALNVTSSNWFTSCSLQKQTSTDHFHVARIHAVMEIVQCLGRKSCQPKWQVQEVGGRQNPELAAEVQYAQKEDIPQVQDVDARAAGMAGMTVQAVLRTAVVAVLPNVGLLQNTVLQIATLVLYFSERPLALPDRSKGPWWLILPGKLSLGKSSRLSLEGITR